MKQEEIRDFLEQKYRLYNSESFINEDPVLIPHLFSVKEDIEISGFIAATLAWGQRKTILKKSRELLCMMDNAPYDFLLNAENSDIEKLSGFKHRTFNGIDCTYFIKTLKNIYRKYGGIGEIIESNYIKNKSIAESIICFRNKFFMPDSPERTKKHFSDISKGSTGKRLNMYMRWMIRNEGPVDFGIWNKIPPSALFIPIDLHTGNVSRKLGLLRRKQNDWKAVEELTEMLKKFDPDDPVKYDFALFGLGIYENF